METRGAAGAPVSIATRDDEWGDSRTRGDGAGGRTHRDDLGTVDPKPPSIEGRPNPQRLSGLYANGMRLRRWSSSRLHTPRLPIPPGHEGVLRKKSIQLQVEQCDEKSPREEQDEEAEERPAEAEVPAGEVGVVHVSNGSIAAATKRSAR